MLDSNRRATNVFSRQGWACKLCKLDCKYFSTRPPLLRSSRHFPKRLLRVLGRIRIRNNNRPSQLGIQECKGKQIRFLIIQRFKTSFRCSVSFAFF